MNALGNTEQSISEAPLSVTEPESLGTFIFLVQDSLVEIRNICRNTSDHTVCKIIKQILSIAGNVPYVFGLNNKNQMSL